MDALLAAQPAPAGGPPPDAFVATMLAERDAFAAALENGTIRPHYQPILDLRSGVVMAVEALSRWAHPTRGLLGPADFFSLAHAAGLTVALGERTLACAVRDLARWPANPWTRQPIALHLNLSAEELADPTLPQRVRRITAAAGFEPTRLVFEVPEALVSQNGVPNMLKALYATGARIALDDFGAGDTSLAALRALSLCALKIDRSFLATLGRDRRDATLLAGLMGVARSLDLEIIAVGIEDAAQRDLLLGAACRLGQGFLFSRPVAPELCLRYLLSTPNSATAEVPRRWRVT